MPSRNITIIIISAIISIACYRAAPRNRYALVLVESMRIIDESFVDKVNRRNLFEDAMKGMIAGLDQYSGYINPRDYLKLQKNLDQKFNGIGIVVEIDKQTNRLTVKVPMPNTPARKAGMKAGDTILEIDGTSTENLTLDKAVEKMQGERGSLVLVLLQHPCEDKPVLLEIRRDVIPIESVLGDTRKPDDTWNYYLQEHPNIGYLRLTNFGEETANEMRKALAFKDHPLDALIVDVRDNPGGLLPAVVEICNLFIDRGRIVSTRGRGNVEKKKYEADPASTVVKPGIPVVVLVNGFSASASEILAACLQDHDRALIIGQRTWGKGSVQNIIRLEQGRSGALRLTTASYWRPSGKNIHRSKDARDEDDWGVRPNDGWEVLISEEQAGKIRDLRMQRDMAFSVDQPQNNLLKLEQQPNREDPQLDRAIKCLQQQLEKKKTKARKA